MNPTEQIVQLEAALKNLQVMIESWAEENDHSELVNTPEMIAARQALR